MHENRGTCYTEWSYCSFSILSWIVKASPPVHSHVEYRSFCLLGKSELLLHFSSSLTSFVCFAETNRNLWGRGGGGTKFNVLVTMIWWLFVMPWNCSKLDTNNQILFYNETCLSTEISKKVPKIKRMLLWCLHIAWSILETSNELFPNHLKVCTMSK